MFHWRFFNRFIEKTMYLLLFFTLVLCVQYYSCKINLVCCTSVVDVSVNFFSCICVHQFRFVAFVIAKVCIILIKFFNLAFVSVCMFHCVRLCVSVCNYATRNVFLLKINDNYKSFDFMTNGRRFYIKTSFFSNIKINLYFIKMDLCIFILDVKE